MLWEVFFMLVLLKIPVVYLCAVVWWAIKAEPEPPEGAPSLVRVPRGPGCDWRRPPLLRRRGPLPRVGGPSGRRVPRVAYARSRSEP